MTIRWDALVAALLTAHTPGNQSVTANDFVDNHQGWVALIAAGITTAITAVYVIFTWKLVKQGQAANELTRDAIEADRRQYRLALRNRQDGIMPAVVVESPSTTVELANSTPQVSRPEGLSVSDFRSSDVAVTVRTTVVNHGPGLALIFAPTVVAAAAREATVQLLYTRPSARKGPWSFESDLLVGGAVVGEDDKLGLVCRFVTQGATLLDETLGTTLQLTLRVTAYGAGIDVADTFLLPVAARPGTVHSSPVDWNWLARRFTSPVGPVLPHRTYSSDTQNA